MKKSLFFSLFFIFLLRCVVAQTWSSVGSGCNWAAHTLAEYNGSLYVGGSMSLAGGVSVDHLAGWNGSAWFNAGAGLPAVSPFSVEALLVYDSALYVAGACTATSGYAGPFIFKWDGVSWDSLGVGLLSYHCGSYISALGIYNNELYAAGVFTDAGGIPVRNIAKWNGSSWDSVGSGLNNRVLALKEYNGELYAGGYFDEAGGIPVHGIAKWNGISWDSVGTGLYYTDSFGTMDGEVAAFSIYDSSLIVGGFFTSAGGIDARNIAKWNGAVWDSLSSVDDGGAGSEPVDALCTYNGNLYAGGSFYYAGGVWANRIARWDGITWSSMGTGMDGEVFAIAPYDGDIYAGGDFYEAGGTTAYRVAKWSLSNNIGEDQKIGKISIYPNPSSYGVTIETEVPYESVLILNSLGEILYTSQEKKTISLASFQSGVYFIQLVDASGTVAATSRFVKCD